MVEVTGCGPGPVWGCHPLDGIPIRKCQVASVKPAGNIRVSMGDRKAEKVAQLLARLPENGPTGLYGPALPL